MILKHKKAGYLFCTLGLNQEALNDEKYTIQFLFFLQTIYMIA